MKKVIFIFILILAVSACGRERNGEATEMENGNGTTYAQIEPQAAPPPNPASIRRQAGYAPIMANDKVQITSPVRVYITTGDERLLFAQAESPEVKRTSDFESSPNNIRLDYEQGFQVIDGFGGSLTDSSAYLMKEYLSEEALEELMHHLFCRERGIGLSYLRQAIGASDFAREMYSYSMSYDPTLENFCIAYDREHIIPLLKKALEINPGLSVMASPWSPPAWMKTSGSMVGGQLRHERFDDYARYLILFLQAYHDEGIPIRAITPQNEPLHVPPDYPGCGMSAVFQAEFINRSLGPMLRKHFPNISLLVYDHNWDEPDFPLTVLERAGQWVDGVAWHHYGGNVSAQSRVFDRFPVEQHFTEGAGGEWVPGFETAFFEFVRNGIGVLRNHGKSYILWNVALDENNGPFIPAPGRRSTVRGIVQIDTQSGDITYNLEYYALAHFSKFIVPGAVRIHSNQHQGIENVAAVNPDGTTTVVLWNSNRQDRDIQITAGESAFQYTLPARSAVTFMFETNAVHDHGKNDTGQWRLVWSDEFDGDALDLGVWEVMTGTGAQFGLTGWGNDEAQYYHADNVTVADGMLRIEARSENRSSPTEGRRSYTSGRIRSTGTPGIGEGVSFLYGRVEARIKLPAGNGMWPAFWMLPTDSPYGGWPMGGEIDIMEAMGRFPGRSSSAIHFGTEWPGNTYTHNVYNFPEGQSITDFNVYAVEWEPGRIRFYVNDTLTWTQTGWWSRHPDEEANFPFPAPFDQPFHILLNLAVGGGFDPQGSQNMNTFDFPAAMYVDYVRVYEAIRPPDMND
ncbi:MAG: family 16 glycosylhydrolase [Defluviitaleaceae bacterium]|nr:family 16 glycosylhydrolase [Defluviitaleaceae bacterium]